MKVVDDRLKLRLDRLVTAGGMTELQDLACATFCIRGSTHATSVAHIGCYEGKSANIQASMARDRAMRSRCANRTARPALAPSPFAREASFAHDVGRLTDVDIARAIGSAASTVSSWLSGSRAPTGERAGRLVELSSLVERLTRLMDPSYIAVWLRRPVPALDDDKPLDVIGRGEYRRVAG